MSTFTLYAIMLVLLCDLSAAEKGGIVAIDEPENSLHPYAIRLFVRLADQLARRNDLNVMLTTHSPVLPDTFNDKPEQVYVLDGTTEPAPVRLSEFKNPEWLRQFRLGELYADNGIVSHDDEWSSLVYEPEACAASGGLPLLLRWVVSHRDAV